MVRSSQFPSTLFGCFVLATLSVQASNACAQDALRSMVSSRTLDNGLQVIVIRNSSIPFIHLQMVIRGGASIQTTDALQGVPHLLEHLLFRSGDESGSVFVREASKIEASWNGSTSNESVQYYLTFPAKHLEKGMELLSDLIRKPSISPEAIEAERKIVQGELERRASEPTLLLRTVSDMLLWEGPGWGVKNPGGNLIALMGAKPDLLSSLHKKYYVPNNAALIIAGDVTDSAAFAVASRAYRGWKRGPDPLADLALPGIPPLIAIKSRVLTADVRNVTILVRWHGPSAGTDRAATYAADVFSGLVNQPLSGTWKRLVDTGVLESVSFGYSTLNHIGPIELTARASPEHAVAAVQAIGAELSKLAHSDYVTDADLQYAKKRQYVESHFRFESSASSAYALADFWTAADLDYFITYADSLEAQTPANIGRFVNTYLKGKGMVAVVLIPQDIWSSSFAAIQRALGAWKAP